jgi:hypothetical protein
MSVQNGWRWCHKCQGFFFSGNPSQGVCPAGGSHDASQSGHYAALFGDGIPGAQDGWRWCKKCQGFFFSLNPSKGVCPADHATHDSSTSGHYSLQFGDTIPGTQGLWRWCQKCQGLFFSAHPSVCPAGGAHDGSASGQYGVLWETLTHSFDTGTGPEQISIGGSPADANVAASSTHVCVTARAAFACYTKGGALVSLGAGFQARPYTAAEFFAQSGISIAPVPSGTPTKDGRVVFDHYRKRFFMAFQTREEHPHLLIAVSKSEDPNDGWWTYSDDVLAADVNGQDYMRIGRLWRDQLVRCIP